jgi:hypothetical protein
LGTDLNLSWPPVSADFSLHWEMNLCPSLQKDGLPVPQMVADQWQVTVLVAGRAAYYRLAR